MHLLVAANGHVDCLEELIGTAKRVAEMTIDCRDAHQRYVFAILNQQRCYSSALGSALDDTCILREHVE